MNRSILMLVVAGLCLATTLSCNGGGTNGPTFPNNWGLELDTLPTELVSNQPIVISWEVYDELLNEFVVSYSDGSTWKTIDKTHSNSLEWKVTADTEEIRVEGFNNDYSTSPLATVFSNKISVAQYGEPESFAIDSPTTVDHETPFRIFLRVTDHWGNIVENYNHAVMMVINTDDNISTIFSYATVVIMCGEGWLDMGLASNTGSTTTGMVTYTISNFVPPQEFESIIQVNYIVEL